MGVLVFFFLFPRIQTVAARAAIRVAKREKGQSNRIAANALRAKGAAVFRIFAHTDTAAASALSFRLFIFLI